MLGRKSALWLAAAIGVLSMSIVPTASGEKRERPCNGSVELCGRSFDQVVIPGTHNSMSNAEYGWTIPNQLHSIPTQLRMGVRGFLIDTHYGKLQPGGTVLDWNNANDGDPHAAGAQTFLCHSFCTLGASDLTAELSKVADFLRANPREALIFVVQNGIHPDDYARAVEESGLIDFVYTGPTDGFPSLREMIASGQRVVMLSEGNTGSVPWFHNGYAGPLQETPYNFRRNEANEPLTTQGGIDLLTQPANLNSTCRPNRGGTDGSLFLMNHWVNGMLDNSNGVVPDPAVARILNQPDVLVARARACEQRRGLLPTLLAVDDFGEGDLLGAVRELNGVEAKAFFEAKRPRNTTVRAGGKARFRIAVSDFGNAESFNTRVCAIVPRRLARKPRCRSMNVWIGSGPGRSSATVTVQTRRIFQGRFRGRKAGRVRFTIRGGGDTVRTWANLKVKPLKKPKGKRAKRR